MIHTPNDTKKNSTPEGRRPFHNRQNFNRNRTHTDPKPTQPGVGHSSPQPNRGGAQIVKKTFGHTGNRHSSGKHGARRNDRPNVSQTQSNRGRAHHVIPPLADGDLRIIPLCGVEWVGTNMTAIEYKDEIIVIDIGFGFPTVDTPGIDYTIPDATYLEERKDKIKAVIITHGHLDHVGGIPYIIEKIGNPPIYTREFGAIFMQKRMEEFPQVAKLNIQVIDKHSQYLTISDNLKVRFFGLTHSIPDSTGVIVQTPLGGIVSTGDVRVENRNGIPDREEVEQYKFFKDEKILLMTMDSTGIISPGWSPSEEVVRETIDGIIKSTTGRLFIGTFSSQVERLISFINSARAHGKYIVIEGRSMKSNLGIAKELKLTDFSHIIGIEEADSYPPNKLVILVTGAQGEQFAALDRISNGTHKYIKLTENDTIVLSSSVVPGNDYSITKLKDKLYRGSYNIITYADNTVHASGHGKREELKWIHTQIPYKFFMPIHGNHFMLKIHADMVRRELGVPRENIVVPDNGSIIEIRENGSKIVMLKEKAPAAVTIVEGSYVGPLHDAVMADRLTLAKEGIFVVVSAINARTKKLKKSPDIISRGFVYLKENQDLLNKVRDLVRKTIEDEVAETNQIDFDKLKDLVGTKVSRFLLQKTEKKPVVIPVILSA